MTLVLIVLACLLAAAVVTVISFINRFKHGKQKFYDFASYEYPESSKSKS